MLSTFNKVGTTPSIEVDSVMSHLAGITLKKEKGLLYLYYNWATSYEKVLLVFGILASFRSWANCS